MDQAVFNRILRATSGSKKRDPGASDRQASRRLKRKACPQTGEDAPRLEYSSRRSRMMANRIKNRRAKVAWRHGNGDGSVDNGDRRGCWMGIFGVSSWTLQPVVEGGKYGEARTKKIWRSVRRGQMLPCEGRPAHEGSGRDCMTEMRWQPWCVDVIAKWTDGMSGMRLINFSESIPPFLHLLVLLEMYLGRVPQESEPHQIEDHVGMERIDGQRINMGLMRALKADAELKQPLKAGMAYRPYNTRGSDDSRINEYM
ncbi:hypothetical protein DFH07DRAFT_773108 [Mycena maculata]|uniref:Uncharacterized protein n=1 Tax=Mycena maculata TaxID=230809 RepID=A0AAD7J4U4_9AGAR|nr:hypothetical protein DFH07DRAFT_773108 [Mycena maculata]